MPKLLADFARGKRVTHAVFGRTRMSVLRERLRGSVVDSLGDHRLALTFAIAGLVAGDDTTILDADCVSISYPTFFADLERIRS